jgi:hypothetical protein
MITTFKITVLEIKKLRFGEVECLVEGHMFSEYVPTLQLEPRSDFSVRLMSLEFFSKEQGALDYDQQLDT